MSLIRRLNGWLCHHPGVAALLALGLLAASLPGIRQMRSDFSIRVWFHPTDPLMQAFHAFETRFGNDDVGVVLVRSPSGIFDQDSIRLIRQMTEEFWQVPLVTRVDSITNFNTVRGAGDDMVVEPLIPDDLALSPGHLEQARRRAMQHPVLPGYLLARDGRATLITLRIAPGLGEQPDYSAMVHGLRRVVDGYQARGDHEFHIGGGPDLAVAFEESSFMDLQRLLPVAALIMVGLLWYFFRHPLGVVFPFLVSLLVILTAAGISGYLGFRVNTTSVLLPQIFMAVSMACTVHFLMGFFRQRFADLPPSEALARTLERNIFATLLTSVSTVFGFLCFSTSPIQSVAEFGMAAALGSALAWIYTVLLAPLCFLRARRKPAQAEARAGRPRGRHVSPAAAAFTVLVHRYRFLIIAVFIGLASLGSILSMGVEVNSNMWKYFKEDTPTRMAWQAIQEHVGSSDGPELIVENKGEGGVKDPAVLRKVEKLENWLRLQPQVTKVVSLLSIIRELNRALHGGNPAFATLPASREEIAQLLFLYNMNLPRGMDINNMITTSQDALRLSVRWNLADSRDALRMSEDIENKARQLGLKLHITGKHHLLNKLNPYLVDTFLVSLSWAILSVGALLLLVFRSPRIGLLALFPNVVPLLICGAILRLLQIPLDIGTVIVFSVCLGIAVDDTIHLLSHFEENRRSGYSSARSLALVFTETAPALITTTVVLALGFGTMIFASFVPNTNFAMMVAVVFTMALLTDLFLLPALLLAFSKTRNIESVGEAGPVEEEVVPPPADRDDYSRSA